MGIALLKALKENNIELEHTEVGVIISGSEECGLRGGKAWAEAHKDDYNDVPTIIVSYDTIHDPKCMQVNFKDLNALVTADKEGSELFLQACEDVGVYCGKGTVPFGATDCAAFTQGGFRSVGVTGLAHTLEKYYHTRLDSYDNLDEQGIENCYAATVGFLQIWDHKYSEE
jgi:putative aminopeptidase FrvX